MKKLLIIIILAIASLSVVNDTYSNVSTSSASSFCSGFKDGYIEGYCYDDYPCATPLVPVCPNPRNGENTYQGGYNRGFVEGLNDRR